nr:hypothetical protein [Tanacetum cinerariifolium]
RWFIAWSLKEGHLLSFWSDCFYFEMVVWSRDDICIGREERKSKEQVLWLVKKLGNVEDKAECKKLKKELEETRIMPPKSAPLTQAAIRRMIKENVDVAIATERARQANVRNDASASGPVMADQRSSPRFQVYQGRLLARFQDDAKYKHGGQDTRLQGGKDDQDEKDKDLKISNEKTKSKDIHKRPKIMDRKA